MVERLYVSPVPLLETMVSVPFLEVKNPENDSFGGDLVQNVNVPFLWEQDIECLVVR
jgi:hypothetical protein